MNLRKYITKNNRVSIKKKKFTFSTKNNKQLKKALRSFKIIDAKVIKQDKHLFGRFVIEYNPCEITETDNKVK